MKAHISILGILVVLASSSMSGCSQTSSYGFNAQDGFVTDYPALGQDIGPVVQAILNREGNPATNRNATNGQVSFQVLSAKVMKAGDVTPSRDGLGTSIWFHSHLKMFLPNGQMVEDETFESMDGTWRNGRVAALNVNQVIGTSYVYGNPPDLYVTTPRYLENLKSTIAAAYNRGTLQSAICDATSIETLFWQLRGHDLVHTQYDFTTWKEANQIAMAHADSIFCGTGDAFPPELAPPPPVAQTPPPPGPAPKQIVDRFSLSVAGVLFNVPITDPTWFKYKASLLTPRFDQKSWAQLAAQMSRLQLEQRVHDMLAQTLAVDQRRAHEKNSSYEGHLAQAAYVAGQPGATQQQKDAYAELSRETEARLGPSTRYLLAMKILIDAVQDDINSHQ